MKSLLAILDKNAALSRLLRWISTTLAVNRGLPMLLGTSLVGLSCAVSVILVPVLVAVLEASGWLLLVLLPVLLLHLGIMVAFIGFMMSVPLGKGYHE